MGNLGYIIDLWGNKRKFPLGSWGNAEPITQMRYVTYKFGSAAAKDKKGIQYSCIQCSQDFLKCGFCNWPFRIPDSPNDAPRHCPYCKQELVFTWDKVMPEPDYATERQKMYLFSLITQFFKYPPVVQQYVESQTILDFTELKNTLESQKLTKAQASLAIERIVEVQREMAELKTYTIRIQSPFLLTPTQMKEKLGIGFKVVEVTVEREQTEAPIKDVDSAIDAIFKTGFRALARANHPDIGGDPEVMVILNRAKKEFTDLMKEIR